MPLDDPESTRVLIERLRAGDEEALDRLLRRHLPRLRRWASGRLPPAARHGADTEDLVQETVVRTLRVIGTFEYRREGALQAYLRQALLNAIRGRLQQAGRRPPLDPIDDSSPPDADATSPLEAAIGRENLERYDQALASLEPDDREAIIGRLELGYDYEELATALGRPSVDAARMAVRRALLRLAEKMREREGVK